MVGIAAVLGLWMGTDNVRERVEVLNQRLLASAMQPTRSAASLLAQAEQNADTAHKERAVVERGLQAKEPLELLQTRFLYVLRQRCQAAAISTCVVKFSGEPTRAAGTPTALGTAALPSSKVQALADKPTAEVNVEDLGLAKARAVVSGTFQTRELLDFFNALSSDGTGIWRVNGLTVRGNSFEVDLEQIVRPAVSPRGAY